MAKFTIPTQHQAGLAQIIRLSEADIENLRAALKDAPATLKQGAIKAKLTSEISTIPAEQMDSMISALIALYSLRGYLRLSIPDFVEQLIGSMEESGKDELKIPDNQLEHFKTKVSGLLESDTLTITSKAPDVWFEHKYAFCSARILTDIRSVFGERPEDRPLAAGIVHTLKISYHVADKIEEFYVAMDAGDIKTLKDVLERADAKFEALKSVLEAAQVRFLDSE